MIQVHIFQTVYNAYDHNVGLRTSELGKIIKAVIFSIEVRNMLDLILKIRESLHDRYFSCEVQYQVIIHTIGYRTMRISIAKKMLPISINNTPKIVEFKVRDSYCVFLISR
jgi:hypothetical protein